MTPSSTICVSQEGPANALALNKDATQVVIAGRNVFKVFSIGENEFTEVCNLRVGKNLNLNFSSIDVAWSAIEENTLATAATNGAVVVWNLSRSGRSKQEHVFSDHKRTVNKVSFHLTEPSLLISGSQDGMMKCFDLRIKEVARTFISNTESIRDVQFSPHQAHTFAAVSENGSVQLWDVRRHERCLQQFTAHSGPVFACDWHPDMPWLATASRDKTIKVWEIRAKPNLEHTIYTIASVGHVKWRPQKKWQLASGALVLDCAVHVWDVRRPHVPLASFAAHRDVTTRVAWLAPPAFLATSRDCNLYRHRWSEAAHPVLWGGAHAVSVSSRGAVAQAAPLRPLPRAPPAPPPAPPPAHAAPLDSNRKQPLAGSLTPAAQAALERAFPGGATSVLTRHCPRGAPPASPALPAGSNAFVACAREYRLRGAAPLELAAHNAAVARKYDKHLAAHVFDVVRLWMAGGAAGAAPAPAQAQAPPLRTRARSPPPAPPAPPPEEPWSDARFSNSGVLGLPTHSIYIPKQCADDGLLLGEEFRNRKGYFSLNIQAVCDADLRLMNVVARWPGSTHDATIFNNSILRECGWVSAASVHYVDEAAASWTLRECAGALPASAPPAPPAPLPASPTASSDGSGCEHAHTATESGERSGSEGSLLGGGAGLWVRGEARGVGGARLALAPQLAAALHHHTALGDVQTPVTAVLAAAAHRNELLPYIEESIQEQWLLGYIELLQRHKLWNVATEVIQLSWVSSVWALSQQSSSVVVCCARCGRRAPHAPAPARCPAPPALLCAVCRTVVRGLYAWCQGCSHGGHLAHMQRWMQRHQLCPAGCGHRCQLG